MALVGELDLTVASELTEQLEELAGVPALVIDLNRVHFIDSAALHCLFRLARDRDTSLAFVLEPTSPIATTLAIVELGRAAPLKATLDEAVRALASTAPGLTPPSPRPAPCYLFRMHRVAIERNNGATVVLAAGELDAFAAPDLASVLEDVRGDQRVVADLDRVSFMDSTVLGLIVRATRELGEAGASVRIVLPAGSARRIFEITALDRVLPIAETRGAALAELEA